MITAQVDDREFQKAISRLGRMTRTMPMRQMAVVAHRSVLRNFQAGGRPTKWRPLKQSTIDRRREGRGKVSRKAGLGTKPLLDTATLRNSISFKVFGHSNFKVYTQLIYAAVHQFGSKPGKKPKIPARPYMVWQTEDKQAMVDIVLRHISRGL